MAGEGLFASALANLGTGYLDQEAVKRKQAQEDAQAARQARLDAENAQDSMLNRSITQMKLTQMQDAVGRKDRIAKLITAARGGDEGALGQALAEDPTLAPSLTKEPRAPQKPNVHYDADRGVLVNLDTNSFTPLLGLPDSTKNTITPFQQAQLNLQGRALDIKGDKAAQGPKVRGLPSAAVEKINSLDETLSGVSMALDKFAEAKDKNIRPTGRVAGIFTAPNWARNAVGQGGDLGRSVRSLVANLSSQIGLLRSGGAISDAEFSRLDGFLASINDEPEDAVGKLKDFQTSLQNIKKIKLYNYQKYGFGVGGDDGEQPPDAPSGSPRGIPTVSVDGANTGRQRRTLPHSSY